MITTYTNLLNIPIKNRNTWKCTSIIRSFQPMSRIILHHSKISNIAKLFLAYRLFHFRTLPNGKISGLCSFANTTTASCPASQPFIFCHYKFARHPKILLDCAYLNKFFYSHNPLAPLVLAAAVPPQPPSRGYCRQEELNSQRRPMRLSAYF